MKSTINALKSFATKSFVALFALAAFAWSNAAQAYDYTLVLTNGVAYKNSVAAENIIDTSTMGLTYASGAWTMNGFSFTTTADYGVKVKGETTIKVMGNNTIVSGNLTGVGADSYALAFWDDSVLTSDSAGTLTVTSGSSTGEGGSSMALTTVKRLAISGDVKVNAAARESSMMSVGLGLAAADPESEETTMTASFVAQDSAQVKVTAAASQMSVAVFAYGPVAVSNNAVMVCTAEAGGAGYYGMAVVDGIAKKTGTSTILPFWDDEGFYLDGTEPANDVTFAPQMPLPQPEQQPSSTNDYTFVVNTSGCAGTITYQWYMCERIMRPIVASDIDSISCGTFANGVFTSGNDGLEKIYFTLKADVFEPDYKVLFKTTDSAVEYYNPSGLTGEETNQHYYFVNEWLYFSSYKMDDATPFTLTDFKVPSLTITPIAGETAAQLSLDRQMAGGQYKCVATFVPASVPTESFAIESDIIEVKMSDSAKRQYVGMKAAEVLIGGRDIASGTLLEASFVLGNVDEQVAIFGPTNLATEVYDPYLFGAGSAGIALSSGWATYAITNSTTSETCNNRVTGGSGVEDPYLRQLASGSLNDSISLELKFKSKLSGVLTFDYILASREMDQSVSDPFALFVRDCGTAEEPETNDYQNVAYMPEELNGVISGWTSNVVVEIKRLQEVVKNVENYSDYVTINGSAGNYNPLPNTGWNVFTTKYQTKFTAKKDHIYQIRIVTADLSDQVYDTVVYLRADSLRVKPNPPTLTGEDGVVKDGVFQYATGDATVGMTIKADRAGNVYFSTKKTSSLDEITNAANWLRAPVTTDDNGDGTADIPTVTGAYYAYYVDDRGNFSNPQPFWVAPYQRELATIIYQANGNAFADGTTVKTNVQTRYTFTTDPGYEMTVPEGYIHIGWYLDAECTQQYAFGARLENDQTLYAGCRPATGLIIEGKDIAVDLKGDGWSYDYGNDDYVEIDYNATQPVAISGSTTNTAIYLYYANYYGKKTVLDNVTVDYESCTYSPLYCAYGATIELKGTNTVYSGAGISAFYAYCSGYDHVITGREDGSDALFLYPGEGAEAVELGNGATLKIRGGTYNDAVSPSFVDTSYGYAAFDNGNSTWTAARAWWVTFDGKNGEATSTVPVKRGQPIAKPADPKNGELAFAGWYTDEDCTDGNAYDFSAAVTENKTLYAKWVAASAFVEDEDGEPAPAKDFADAVEKVPEGGQIAVSGTNITDAVVIEKELVISKDATDDLSGVTPGADLVKTNSGDTVVIVGELVDDMTVVVCDRKAAVEDTEKPAAKDEDDWATLTNLASQVMQTGIFEALTEETKTNFVNEAKDAFADPTAVEAVVVTVNLNVTPKNIETDYGDCLMYQYDAQPVAKIVAYTNGVMETVKENIELHAGDELLEGAWFQVTLPAANMMPAYVLHKLSDGTLVQYVKGSGTRGSLTFAHDPVDGVVRLWVQENSDFYVYAYRPGFAAITYDAMGGAFENGASQCVTTRLTSDGYAFPPAPVREGFTFLGWYDGPLATAAEIHEGDAVTVYEVFAKWEQAGITPGTTVGAFGVTADGLAATNWHPTAAMPEDVILPDTVDNTKTGLAIIEIGRAAFTPTRYAGTVKTVSIPQFVTDILPYAFADCAELADVRFAVPRDYRTGAKTRLYIRDWAFSGTALKTITFAAGGTYEIGHNAFSDVTGVEDIYLYGEIDVTGWRRSPFRQIGTDLPEGQKVKLHLSPAKAADAKYVAAITNGMDNACVMLDQTVLGSVATGEFVLGDTSLTVSFTIGADSPWQLATLANTFLLFSGDASEVVVGTGKVLTPTSVEPQDDGSWKATFDKPAETTGFFRVCVGD